jgi:predicted ATPase
MDISHPLIMLTGENGSGKSTLLHSIFYALKNEQVDQFVYRWQAEEGVNRDSVYLFDAEQHNPRMMLEAFEKDPAMLEFLRSASHGQVMLSMFKETFPKMPEGTILLLDEPEMALSVSNQRRVLKMLKELVDLKHFRIICATHSPILIDAEESYVINLDYHINRNILPTDMAVEGASTIQ